MDAASAGGERDGRPADADTPAASAVPVTAGDASDEAADAVAAGGASDERGPFSDGGDDEVVNAGNDAIHSTDVVDLSGDDNSGAAHRTGGAVGKAAAVPGAVPNAGSGTRVPGSPGRARTPKGNTATGPVGDRLGNPARRPPRHDQARSSAKPRQNRDESLHPRRPTEAGGTAPDRLDARPRPRTRGHGAADAGARAGHTSDAADADAEAPAADGSEQETRQARAPWHFKVLLVGTVVYLGWRLYQGIGWLVHHV